MSPHIFTLSATFFFFELTMVSNNYTHEVRGASENFSQNLTLPTLPLLGHMGGGYLAIFPMREDSMTPLWGHMEGGYIYVAISLMRHGDPMNLPLQAITTQGFMLIKTTLP